MTTPSVTNVRPAAMDSKSTSAVPTTTPAVPTTSAVSTPSAESTSSTAFCDCRDVRHDAKRAHRNARCQDTYSFLRHGAFPNLKSRPTTFGSRSEVTCI